MASGLATYLRRLREARGWTQEQASERSEVAQTTISSLETGASTRTSDANMAKLARAYGVPRTALYGAAGLIEGADTPEQSARTEQQPIRTYDDVAQLLRDYSERQIATQVQAALRSIRLPIVNALSAQDAGNLDRQTTDTIEVPPWLVEGVGDPVLFIVAGECLGADDIRTGDLVIIDRSITEPHDGEIVAARVNGEETLKHYHHLGDRVELRPSAAGFAPIVVREGSVEIIGVYAGVIRRAGRGRR